MNPREIPLPARMKSMPIDPVRGFVIPWFIAWLDGKPEFRIADTSKLVVAIRERRCWVCGQRRDNRSTYVIGPMCAINRISSEPPCHPECARYSVQVCPFLSRPNMDRREAGLPDIVKDAPEVGMMIRRNPGVSLLWTAKTPGATIARVPNGFLFELWPPTEVSFWAEGRQATRAEVDESVRTGLPILRESAMEQGAEAVSHLGKLQAEAEEIFAMAGLAR